MSESSPSLRELIDIDELQSIQDSFARAAGISSVILSPEGEPLTRFTNPTGFYSLIQSTEKGKERCFRSFMEMGAIALQSETPESLYSFAHGGHFVAPIMIDGEHKGTVFVGQFIPEKFSSEQLHDLEKIALEIDLDPGLLVKEAEKMYVAGEDVIRNYSSLLFKIVETVARTGAQAAELRRVNDVIEKAHDELELRFRDVAGAMSDWVWEVDAGARYTYCSEKVKDVLGYSAEEMIGKTPFDLMLPDEADSVGAAFVEIIRERRPFRSMENWLRTKDGRSVCMSTSGVPIVNDAGELLGYRGVDSDITERKKAEEVLQATEERFRMMFESMSNAVAVYDVVDRGKNFIFKDFNKAAEELEGVMKEDLIGKSVIDVFPGVVDFGLFDVLHRVWQTGEPEHYPISFYKDERIAGWRENYVYKLPSGEIVVIYEDVTERKAAEEELKETTKLLQSIMDNATDEVIVATDWRGIILNWNEGARRLLGYEPEEVVGKESVRIFHTEEYLKSGILDANIKKMIATGKPLIEELNYVAKDGRTIPVQQIVNPRFGEDGEFAGLVGMTRDITERKRVEKALDDRIEFEKIVTAISTGFINLTPDEIDIGIEDALKSIGEFAGVDRSYVFRLFDGGTAMDNTHEWCARGIVPQIENLHGLRTADFPWLMAQLNRFETVHIPVVADLPLDADVTKEILQSQDILSVILVPMVYGGTLVGYIGFDSVMQEKRWSDDDIALLKVVGEIFVNAIERRKIVLERRNLVQERKRVMTTLRESEEKYRTIYDSSKDAIMTGTSEGGFLSGNPATVEIFGCKSEKDFISRAPYELSPQHQPDGASSSEKAKQMVAIAMEKGSHFFEWTHKRVDGEEFPTTVLLARTELQGRMVVQATVRDITEQKNAEEELQERMKELETFYRATLGREDRVIELKQEVNELSEQLGKNKRYRDYSE